MTWGVEKVTCLGSALFCCHQLCLCSALHPWISISSLFRSHLKSTGLNKNMFLGKDNILSRKLAFTTRFLYKSAILSMSTCPPSCSHHTGFQLKSCTCFFQFNLQADSGFTCMKWHKLWCGSAIVARLLVNVWRNLQMCCEICKCMHKSANIFIIKASAHF